MNRVFRSRVGRLALVSALGIILAACGTTKPHEQAAQLKADEAGLTAVEQASFDGTFVAPGAQFSQYRRLLVEQLDMTDVDILQPSSSHSHNREPWALSDNDKRYYQERYTEALINNLVADGSYATAMDAGTDVLRVKARVVQIAPLASKDDAQGRPGIMKVYSEGFGTMTLELSLYDSASDKLLAIITDQRNLGRLWEENTRALNNRQVRIAFNAWLNKLRTELQRLARE